MVKLSSRKLNIICVVLVIILIISTASSIYLHNENKDLKNDRIEQYYSAWSVIYRMSDYVKRYIDDDCIGGEEYLLYVNQVCYQIPPMLPPGMASDFNFILTTSYDPLFGNLAREDETLNREKAIDLLKRMNSELMDISKNVLDAKENKKEKAELFDQSSTKYKEINAKVADFSNKYTELVDEYFRTNK